ncbi:MAG: hypothetical protein J3R72DRAFT_473906 [Linnemannia gamsii]|nr:MAG: hypothetical protein J3R72DRAFT_473906 [Linnemannia gamsii]
MPQDNNINRRKSRIGPGLKRSIGAGGPSSVAQVDIPHTLFSSLRHDQQQHQQQHQQQQDTHPLRRSQHYYTQDASLDQHHHNSNNNNQQSQSALSPMQPISKVLEDPVERLCLAVDQLVEKMAVVADIHAGLANFNESFGSLLYGLKMTAANVEWTEAPTKRSFERQEQREAEAIILLQQQEELEKIRHQQIMEKEREMERQRQEVERLEAERARAAMTSLHSSSSQNSGGNSGSRLKRPGTVTSAAVGTSRIPPRRVQGTSRPTNQAGASRVGAGGVRKLTGKLVMKRMAERLPLRYRDEPHRAPIEAIMRTLAENIEGQTLPDLVAVAGVARHRCNEYLGILIHAKEVIKTSQKGVVFSLNPDRYPSR